MTKNEDLSNKSSGNDVAIATFPYINQRLGPLIDSLGKITTQQAHERLLIGEAISYLRLLQCVVDK